MIPVITKHNSVTKVINPVVLCVKLFKSKTKKLNNYIYIYIYIYISC